jgi:hypothetical protein
MIVRSCFVFLPLLALVLLAGCAKELRVVSGLHVGADGSISESGPETIRKDFQDRIVSHLTTELRPRWRVAVEIQELPFSFDGKTWVWDRVRVAVRIHGDGSESMPPLTLSDIAGRIQDALGPHIRSGDPAEVTVVVTGGKPPALPSDTETRP